MLSILEKHLKDSNAFSGRINDHLTKMTKVVTGEVNQSMKLAVAVSELMLFSSQFRRYIKLPNETGLIPVNAITFVLAPSGASKDKSMKAIRGCLSEGYKTIEESRKRIAKEQAIKAADEEGLDKHTEWSVYKEFYTEPAPLFTAMTNPSAYLDYLAHIESLPLGSGYLYSGELGSELQTNQDMIPAIRIMSELYDTGYKETKPLKDRGSQTPEIKNLAVSSLLIGSYDNILYDESIKSKFKLEFTTKLARRSFFSFNPGTVKPKNYASISAMLQEEQNAENIAAMQRIKLNELSGQIAAWNIEQGITPLEMTKECKDLFDIYKRYNKEVSSQISKLYPISIIVREHSHWKTLKLAAALAIFNCQTEITAENYIEAISITELLQNDMRNFEDELRKEKYEQFVDYMHYIADEGKATITAHSLKKMGYITSTSSIDSKLRELVTLASSLDSTGLYTQKGSEIHYEEIIRTDLLGASCIEVSGTKEDRQYQCSGQYQYFQASFPDLASLLNQDYAFSNFKFKDGKRGKDNIDGGTKWVCLDIDNSKITDEEAHYMLMSINHHIARTSDPDNPFKFRIIIELDSIVTLEGKLWKNFIESISNYLSIKADLLPPSQIFFGYEGRNVLSVADKNTLEAKDHILMAQSKESQKKSKPVSDLPKAQKTQLLAAPMSTFERAFEADFGSGSRNMMWAAYYAHELGATNEEIIDLVHRINDYWEYPMEARRLDNTIISQIKRF